ncbi:MAG: aminotransferase class I/II-fold pyridoxal phosphate-dependent enzyme [Candidatus Eremiobacteraeota bacterium]|nr:aminotransferase class I/II-fold pyridoxal phosphate-dependent enzyme [Candidatus Eremiobacteraeota bacterium]
MIRPTAAVEAIPATTPFVGPEQLMRETGQRELVRLGANESAFGLSPKALASMTAELPRLAWYGDPESLDLRDALAAKHRCRPEQIVVGSGIDELMGLAVRAFMAPEQASLTTRGTYPTFAYHVAGYGGRLIEVPYRDEGTPDCEALLAAARRETPPVVYLANPDNPSGRFIPKAEVERFYEALSDDALLLLDEAYADFVDENELFDPVFSDRLIRLRTFSKAYGMAGARIGYALLSERNARAFQKIRLHYGVNRNAQIGALASLGDEEFRRYVVDETARARDEYYRLARALGRRYIESATNFVCIEMETPERATMVVRELLARGVWIRKPGAPPLDSYIRVSAGTEPMRAAFAGALRSVLAQVCV